MNQAPIRVPRDAIWQLIYAALITVGLRPTDAAITASCMTDADVTGADGHGVFRLPQYVRRIKAGGINLRPNIRITRTAPATAMVDGDNGMGHVVMTHAAETAIELARETGIAWVGARRSNHAGSAGVYAEEPLRRAGMIGIYSVVASANHMAMWGGAETLLGTNPLAVAIPAGEEAPVVLDMATTVVSYGTVKNYRLQGKPMPEGWMVSRKDGEPLTDAARSDEGLLLPIGGYKGSGLAIVLGLLSGTLNGAAFGRDVVDFNHDDASAADTGHFIIALDVARFVPLATFKAEVDRHIRDLRNSQRLPGVEAIRVPGGERAARRADREENGIPLARELIAQLDALAKELDIERLEMHCPAWPDD
jgi:L-2-hydroxycarboxylate dehydrogenase (NAD+)